MHLLSNLRKELQNKKDPLLSKVHQRFFKTGIGEYGEGDQFLGIKVPELRKIAKLYQDLNFRDLKSLIQSPWHEERLLSLFILIKQYDQANDENQKTTLYNFYIKNIPFVNNWDLVDLSAPNMVGRHLFNQDKSILKKWAKSKNLWERRIAIVSTHCFIRHNLFDHTLKIAKLLLNDSEDLIHKAVGWMLREVGKRNLDVEERFLKQYYKIMPRTMLRYAIERFEENKRQDYLKGRI